MKNFVKRTKRFFIIALVFVFCVSLVSPALATNYGIIVDNSKAVLGANQNDFWGVISSGSDPTSRLIKLQTFTSPNIWNTAFDVDPSGNVTAAGTITPGSASGVCLSDGCKTSWSAVGGLPAAVGTGNFLQTSGGTWVSQLIPAISSTYFTSLSGANLTNLDASDLTGTIPAGTLGNSSVFIGTTAVPLNRTSGPLTLAGVTSALATALAANGTNCTAGNYPLGVDASGNAEGCTAASGGGIGGNGTTNTVAKFTAGTTLGNSIITDNGSGVGISSTFYNAKLNFVSDATGILIGSTRSDGSWPGSLKSNGWGSFSVAGGLAVGYDWPNSSQSGMIINGNVGIGTTAAGAKLHINGSANTWAVQSTGQQVIGYAANASVAAGTGLAINANVGIGTAAPNYLLGLYQATANPHLEIVGDNGSGTSGGLIVTYGAGGAGRIRDQLGISGYNGYLSLVEGAGGTTAVNLTASGNSYLNGGNVGIGTTNPIARLDFGATGSGVPLFYLNSSVDLRGFGLDMSGNGYEFSNFFPSNASSRYAIGTYNGTTFNTKMVVLNNGNVGIGSMAPGSKLDILGGDINLSINRALRHNGVWTIGSDGTTISVGSTATARNVGIYTNGATPTVYANTSGNVGIGTTNPGYKFAVVAPGCGDGIVAVSGSTSGRADLSVACGNQAGIVDIYDQTGTLRSMLQSNGYSFLGGGNLSISADGYHYANELLDVFGGNGHVQAGYSWYSGSDVRLKKNITELDNSLQKVLSLRGVRYDLKTDNNSIPGQGKNIGFIAQELEQQYPELVLTDKDGMKSVAYDKMTAILVEAIKEQQKQIDAQQKEIDALKAK